MRSVFSVDLPMSGERYPSTLEIIDWMGRLGWEPSSIREQLEDQTVESLIRQYQVLAADLLQPESMPELPGNEKQHVIFYGYLTEEQVRFIITRVTPEQVTFRLIHEQLHRLQAGSERMVKKILSSRLMNDGTIRARRWGRIRQFWPIPGSQMAIGNGRVTIYERGFDHELIGGRVVPHASLETLRRNPIDTLLFIVPILLFPAAAAGIVALSPLPADPSDLDVLLLGNLERGSTALLTTSLVSALGLVGTYFTMRGRTIAWSVPSAA